MVINKWVERVGGCADIPLILEALHTGFSVWYWLLLSVAVITVVFLWWFSVPLISSTFINWNSSVRKISPFLPFILPRLYFWWHSRSQHGVLWEQDSNPLPGLDLGSATTILTYWVIMRSKCYQAKEVHRTLLGAQYVWVVVFLVYIQLSQTSIPQSQWTDSR